ncbi:hypothetical protein SLOPH_2297 [Spraguea lophii 42_110]|uniref:Uncharacterized protein n=1 Tax=Spraguea lophii (strain 42_110) TaxID=1358809 RepID=S7XLB0_SPRLO|nr:hypothetical protein SLOPH_2297 [Spraguea lophii 42_110]
MSDDGNDTMDDSEVSVNNIDDNINNTDDNDENIITNITNNNTSYITNNITNNLDTIGSSSILIALITVAQFDIPYMFISTKNDIKNINRRIEYKDKKFNTVIKNFIDENNFYALNYNDDSIYNIFYNIDLLTQHMDDADI